MNISPKTVKTCLGRIKVKMQAPSEANLIVMLLNAGARKGPRDLPIAPQAIADRHRKRPTRENGISALDAVVTRAIEVIGDRIEAMRWLGTPVRALNYATPISLLGTPEGLTRVADVLGQMEHGIW